MTVRKPDVDPDALRAVLARAFPGSAAVRFERTADGVANQVYRLTRNAEVFYLRVAEEAGEDLRADAQIHARLRALGVRVPEVIYVEPCSPELNRSILVMREIPGVPLSQGNDPEVARRVAREAGRDSARINSIAVDGFGWIDRSGPRWPPSAASREYSDFASENIPARQDDRHRLLHGLFDDRTLNRLDEIVDRAQRRPIVHGWLAHGDLDVTAIYADGPTYSGIIDFSELRGAEPEFDLGHFLLHDQETASTPLFAEFLAGHREVSDRNVDLDGIRQVAILVGLRQLCRWLHRGTPHLAAFRAAQLTNLVEGRPACPPRD